MAEAAVPPAGRSARRSLCALSLVQVLLDDLDPEDIVSCLLSLLHRVGLSERWSVNYTRSHHFLYFNLKPKLKMNLI